MKHGYTLYVCENCLNKAFFLKFDSTFYLIWCNVMSNAPNALNCFSVNSGPSSYICVFTTVLVSVPPRFRKEEAALNKFHHLRRKVAAAQWLTPLIDAALIMIIACLSCCCFAFPNTLPCLFFCSVSYPGIHGSRCPTDVWLPPLDAMQFVSC